MLAQRTATLSYGVSRAELEAAIVDRAVEATRSLKRRDVHMTWSEHLGALEYSLAFRLAMVRR